MNITSLPEIVHQMEERIDREAPSGEAGILWTSTYLLMGLRYKRPLIHQLLKGGRGMNLFAASPEKRQAAEDLLWALFNTKEFAYIR